MMVSGTVTKLAGRGASVFSAGWVLSFWMKLIGCTQPALNSLAPLPASFVTVPETIIGRPRRRHRHRRRSLPLQGR